MHDDAVSKALRGIANAPNSRAQYVAHCLPRILSAPGFCKRRLLEIAASPELERPDRLIQGLIQLNVCSEAEVVSAVWPHIHAQGNADASDWAVELLFSACHSDARVRALALERLDQDGCPIETIARVYQHDDEIRKKILARAVPLPPHLRRDIALRAAQRPDDPLLRAILTQWQSQDDPEIKSVAVVGLCTALVASGEGTEPLQNTLRPQRHHDCVPAWAVAGLIDLGRIDWLLESQPQARLTTRHRKLLAVLLHDDAPTALASIAEHWDRIESTFGRGVMRLLGTGRRDSMLFWRRFAPHVTRSPAMLRFFTDHCERDVLGEPALSALASLYPGSSLLLDACCRALGAPPNRATDLYQRYFMDPEYRLGQGAAARILASDFHDSEVALASLVKAVEGASRRKDDSVDIPFIGLAAGWPKHPLVQRRAATIWQKGKLHYLTHGGLMWVSSVCSSSHDFAALTLGFVGRKSLSGWDFAWDALQAIRHRLASDQDPRRLLLNVAIRESESASICASVPQLLAVSAPLDETERERVHRMLDEECRQKGLPRIGLDATVNRFRPLIPCLSEALKGQSSRAHGRHVAK